MSDKRTKPSMKVADTPLRGRVDLPRMRAMTEEEIMRTSPPELADLPDDFWDEAVLVLPGPKHAISLRVDEEVLAWFKSLGSRYQTRMNAVLWSYMTRMKQRRQRKARPMKYVANSTERSASRRDEPRTRRERQ